MRRAYQYHHPDRLGIRFITNASGGVITEQAHLPFGTTLPQTSTAGSGEGSQSSSQPNPHQRRFTSYERSTTTNLDYAVNRQYAAEQGRFTQVDPIGMAAVSLENPQTLNLYAYCGNDPVNHTDPSGLLPKWLKTLLTIAMWALTVITAVNAVFAAFDAISKLVAGFKLAHAFGKSGWAALKIALGNVGQGSTFRGLMNLVSKVVGAINSVAAIFKKSNSILGYIGTASGFFATAQKTTEVWFRFITGTASQIAQWTGQKRVSAVLGLIGIFDSVRNLYLALRNDIGPIYQIKEYFWGMKKLKMITIGINAPFNKTVAVLLWLPAFALAKLFPGNTLPVGYLNAATYFLRRLALYEQWLSIRGKIEGVEKAFASSSSPGNISPVGTGVTSDNSADETVYGSTDKRFSNLQFGPFHDFARGVGL